MLRFCVCATTKKLRASFVQYAPHYKHTWLAAISLYSSIRSYRHTEMWSILCSCQMHTHNITPRWIVSRYLNASNAIHFVRSFFLLLFSLSVGAKFISKFLGMNDSILRFIPSTRVSFGSKLLHWESYDLNRSLWLNFKLQFALQCAGKCSSEVI